MTPADPEAAASRPEGPPALARRLLACIRFDEVLVLQGAPLLGACFAMQDFSVSSLSAAALLVIGNLCLVAHVFVLNDWAGIDGDAKDPHRAAGTFIARGVRRAEVGALALALLALAVVLFSTVSLATLGVACAIAALSALYSAPRIHGKGRPVFNSALHLVGGTLHFLLGYSALASISAQSLAMGCYFGIVFAAGHLTHEARDHDGDLTGGIRTNAVAFGRRQVVLASLLLFSVAYALLTALALRAVVPRALAWCAVLYPIHLWASWQAMRSGLDFKSLSRLQHRYRRIHAVIGITMLVTVLPW